MMLSKKHCIWGTAIICLYLFGCQARSDTVVVPAVTRQGHPVDLEIIQYGRIMLVEPGRAETVGKGPNADDVRLQFQSTDTDKVPLKNGGGFAYRVKIPPIPSGDKLAIDVVVTLAGNSIDMTAKRTEISARLHYDHSQSGKIRNISWIFSDNNTRYHRVGDWTMSLYNAGKLLMTKPFTVTAV